MLSLLRRRPGPAGLTAGEYAVLRRLIRNEELRLRSGRRLYVVPATTDDPGAELAQLLAIEAKLRHLEVRQPR